MGHTTWTQKHRQKNFQGEQRKKYWKIAKKTEKSNQIKFCLFAKWQVITWWGDSEKKYSETNNQKFTIRMQLISIYAIKFFIWVIIRRNFYYVCMLFIIGFRYSFICQSTSTRRQRSDPFGLRVKLPPVTTSLTTQR